MKFPIQSRIKKFPIIFTERGSIRFIYTICIYVKLSKDLKLNVYAIAILCIHLCKLRGFSSPEKNKYSLDDF